MSFRVRFIPALVAVACIASWWFLRNGNQMLRSEVDAMSVPAGQVSYSTIQVPISAPPPPPEVRKRSNAEAPPWGNDDDPVVVPASPGEFGERLGEMWLLLEKGMVAESAPDDDTGNVSQAKNAAKLMVQYPPVAAAAQLYGEALSSPDGGSEFTAGLLSELMGGDSADAREIRRVVSDAWREAELRGLLAADSGERDDNEELKFIATRAANRLRPLVATGRESITDKFLEGYGVLEQPRLLVKRILQEQGL
ncbi:MAG: hypothetical protein R3F19_23915 [Verrucomicrobiales bacterium]